MCGLLGHRLRGINQSPMGNIAHKNFINKLSELSARVSTLFKNNIIMLRE